MRLSELKTGEKGVVVKVYGHGGFRKRIIEMGFIKGKTVEVILNAPLKDPIKYKLMGYEISLRRQEAALIEVLSEEEALMEQNERQHRHSGSLEEHILNDKALRSMALDKRREINIALVGNPNSGKTSLFNIVSGAHEHVGNYSGVTVQAKVGHFDYEGYRFNIVDLPGTYSLSAYSPEELFVRKHILEETPDIILNVVDSSNLERNLYLTTQLIDMNVRMVVALNIYDELENSGNTLNYIQLSKLFGVPMIPTVSRRKRGIEELFHVIIKVYEGADFLDEKGEINEEVLEDLRQWEDKGHTHKKSGDKQSGRKGKKQLSEIKNIYRHIHINHGTDIEPAIDRIKEEISKNEEIRHKYSTRFLAIKLLEKDREFELFVQTLPNGSAVLDIRDKECAKIFQVTKEDCESSVMDAKYAFIDGALKETFTDNHLEKRQVTKVLDSIVTHRVWGFPIFFLFMFLMFWATFTVGAYPMEWIEALVGYIGELVQDNMDEGILKDLIVDGIIGGVGGVIVFLPNILILYFFISLMEDSGYMARAAFIMDKIMHKMGLHGKSFIPLVMGFGCNVPAILASRTVEDRKSRLVTILINPLMSCSARLPVYLLLVGAFFPKNPSIVLFSVYLVGIILAVILARVFSRFLVKGEDTPFVMELPPYRLPTYKVIFRHTWEKGEQYLKKMGGIIMVASIIIWFLGYYPRDVEYATDAEQQEHSYIGRLGKTIEPVIKPLGFDWKLGIGLITGAGAKELVVSTMGVLYANDDEADSVALAGRLPFSPLVAYAFMIFVALYFPCIASLVAIKQETGGWKWPLFTAMYTTALAWVVAFLIYQIGSLILY